MTTGGEGGRKNGGPKLHLLHLLSISERIADHISLLVATMTTRSSCRLRTRLRRASTRRRVPPWKAWRGQHRSGGGWGRKGWRGERGRRRGDKRRTAGIVCRSS